MPNTGSDATYSPHSSKICALLIDTFTLDHWPRRVPENECESNDTAAHNIKEIVIVTSVILLFFFGISTVVRSALSAPESD